LGFIHCGISCSNTLKDFFNNQLVMIVLFIFFSMSRFYWKMAEGHQAVAFSFAITHEGLDVNFDFEVKNLLDCCALFWLIKWFCYFRFLGLLPEVQFAHGERGDFVFRCWEIFN
jgi:hypothetical protein